MKPTCKKCGGRLWVICDGTVALELIGFTPNGKAVYDDRIVRVSEPLATECEQCSNSEAIPDEMRDRFKP